MNAISPRAAVRLACIILPVLAAPVAAQIAIPPIPLNSGQSNPPLVMLVAGKDHKLFYEAYNDAADLNGDGNYNIRFDPTIEYYGLFDSKLCYKGKGKNITGTVTSTAYTVAADYFYASGPVLTLERKNCSGAWSGNFLNYVTTSRMDALRKVLYGGLRSVDTATQTILRRAYVPRDAHGWGKEYTSVAEDKYNISDFTPLALPSANKRHFFGSYTMLGSCATASNCRDSYAPVLHVAQNAAAGKRIWDWAAADSGSLFSDSAIGASNQKYVAQVEVCQTPYTLPDGTQNYRGDNCKPYTNTAGLTVFKPSGLLHKFGENGSMQFGLLTGSYNKNLSGGVLRKAMGTFASEVNPQTGQFTSSATIVQTFDRLMIRSFEYSGATQYVNHNGGSAWVGGRIMNEGEFPDWGNPIAEMMYESLRYLGNTGAPTAAFDTSGSHDQAVGLPRVATWDKPYTRVPWCTKPNILVLSDINPSFDSDQLPGARFKSCSTVTTNNLINTNACNTPGSTSFTGSFGTLNVGTLTDDIGVKENIHSKNYFIGQSGSTVDWAPTAKSVSTLSTVRGLAPEEPGKEGSYYSAAVAYYGKKEGIQTAAGHDNQKVDTYVVALASPLPKIEVPTPQGTVTIIPFGKSTKGSGYNINANKGNFQPANQIVEFYIKSINPQDPSNGGRYHAVFLVSYEDMEQGADHDMDVIAEYEVWHQADNTVKVNVTPTYQSAGITLNIGYNISGTTKDGPYIVVVSRSDSPPYYYLNVPDSRDVGWCSTSNQTGCAALPACNSGTFGSCGGQFSTRTFTPSSNASAATLLKDPLWYAAKWGGFRDRSTDAKHWPDVPGKWDSTGTGTPDNYFLVRNALGLQDALEKALNSIKEGASSSGGIDTSSEIFGATETLGFSTRYDPADWSGDLIATVIVPVSDSNPDGLGPVKWRAADKLAAANSRRIFTRNNASEADIASTGVEFRLNKLNPAQQASLSGFYFLNAGDVIDYVRGSDSKEVTRGGSFRDRTRVSGAPSPLGDSPNNTPLYVKTTKTVYLGANDGMLHAFDTANGNELFAYIPSAMIPRLPQLTRIDYTHDYYVDGETQAAAVGSRTYLIGAPGRGGKGLYGLDITNPAAFSASDVKWELNGPTNWTACGGDANRDNMGLVLSKPMIATLNDGNTYALVGNGYNSCYGRAALYIVNIATGAVKKRLDAPILPGVTSNGLSAPALLDADGDGKVDVVYAGDLYGSLWRFDLSSSNPGDWKVRFGGADNVPMFTAVLSGKFQPITAAPLIAVDNDATPPRTYVLFGTGSYLTAADKSNKDIQSYYGLIDDGNTTIARSQLRQRHLGVNSIGQRTAQVANAGDMDGMRGWYVDFNIPSDAGERVIDSGLVTIVSRGAVLTIPSIIPTEGDPCAAGGDSDIFNIEVFGGGAPDFPFLDLNGDGVVNDKDIIPGPTGIPVGIKIKGMIRNLEMLGGQGGKQICFGTPDGSVGCVNVETGVSYRGRVSWRELND
ncbi:MAG: pilus assembly protein [Azoarcus sp.]|jgi:type IV pilus assembly protein PilY1|nr:pilus assembly protein [Azoarcus sp.]